MRYSSAAVILLLLAATAHAQDEGVNPNLMPPAPLNEKILRLPGDPTRPVSLEVTLFTPPGTGPFPLAIVNHGATHASNTNRGARYRYTFAAYYFLSRGYAVALPMARGFAESGGELLTAGCALDQVGEANARDLAGVIEGLRLQPDIDGNRIVVAGQSFGGWTTIALGTMDVPGVRGLIGFAPALRASDCTSQDNAMIEAARAFGAKAKRPSLWFYGENDTIMPVATWRRLFEAYVSAGGSGTLASVGRFLSDSHQLLSYPEGLAIWVPWADAFLKQIGLASQNVHPDYLPLPTPPPTHFSKLDDVATVPLVNDKGRDAYRKFLQLRVPRVFAIAPNGTISMAEGGFDPLARTLAACRKVGLTCQPYAVDSDIVWTNAPSPAYQRTVPAGQSSLLNFSWDINRDCTSRGRPQLSVSQPPEHGTAIVADAQRPPHFPPESPYAACNAVPVDGVTLSYLPAPGFTGSDTIGFEEKDSDGNHREVHMVLTVQ